MAKELIQQADSWSNSVEQSHTLSASVQTGDVVFAVHANDYYTLARLETPGGTGVTTWGQVTACTLDMGTNDLHGKVWKGTVTTSGGTVTENAAGTDEERYFGIWVFREGDFDAGGSNAGETASTSHVAPSLTPTAGKTDDHYVALFTSEGGQTNYTPPGAPWNARTERDTGFNTYRGGEELLTSDTASGTRTYASSASTKFGTMAFLVKGTAASTTPVGKDLGLPWNTRASVGDPVQLIWNVEFLEPTFVADRASLAPVISSEASTLVDMAGAGSITTGPDQYLIARVSANNSGTSGAACTLTVSDARNGSWTVHGPGLQDPGAADAGVACYVAIVKVTNAYTNGDDVTFTWSPNCTGKTIVIEEWRGIHSSNPVAVVATTAAGASGTPSISRTPTAAGQLFYGCLAIEGLLADTYTQDSDTTDGTWSGRTSQGGTGTATSTVTVRGATKLVTGTSAQTWNPAITSRDWAAVALVLAPYVATTPVGKDLGLIWNARAPVGDTVQTVWDTRAPIGDPLQMIWDTRAVIGDPFETFWSTRALVSDICQALWDVRAALADDLQLVWNVEAAALVAVGKELGLLWGTRALATDQLQAVWDTRVNIGDPFDLLWSTRALAGDTVQALWDTRALAGDTLESLWNVRQALGDPLGVLWDTRAVIGDELNAQWGVRIFAGDSLEALWSTRALAGDQIQLLWDVNGVLAAIGKNLGLLWDTRAPASGTIQALWDIRTPVNDAVALEWGVRTMIGDSVQALWTIRALVGDEAALLWSTRAVAGDTVQALWDIRAFIGDNVILQWNVESLVPPAIIPDKLILSSVPDNLHGLEAVSSTLTLTALED